MPTRVDPFTTGFPWDADVAIEDVASRGWTLFEDLVPPVMVLRESALAHNVELMRSYCRERGVELAPHGKTTMAPALWARQLEAGAWGISAATPVQARSMRAVGVPRILLANELVDAAAIAWVAGELHDPAFDFACWVDSVRGVGLLRERLAENRAPRPLPVLLELGHRGGRTGCRSVTDALDVADSVDAAPELLLAGVAGYEGTICNERSPGCLGDVHAFLTDVRTLALHVLDRGDVADGRPFVVTAGGSAFFDCVADVLVGRWPSDMAVEVVLRAGCYLTHDHGAYERLSPMSGDLDPQRRFRPAIEVWGSVVSTPERGVAVVAVGKRDVPADLDLPAPLWIHTSDGGMRDASGVSIARLMDQHAICRVDVAPGPAIGDLVGFGISHPCTAFDRRRVIPVVDDDGRVVEAIETLF